MSNSNSDAPLDGGDDALIDRPFIAKDCHSSSRTTKNWEHRGILPRPDTQILGRDFWRLGTYRAWKARVLAGDFKGPIARRTPQRPTRCSRAARGDTADQLTPKRIAADAGGHHFPGRRGGSKP